ncbi:MAG: hypothetical protein KJS98_03990 [Nitrospirae bacterium]|nr:hypothetical protein [Nitrospirota bacterium]MDE3049137.1 hypothetical protein [Nitrospirota bacterium]
MKKRVKKREEQVGSSSKSTPEHDATDAKWLDDSLEYVQKPIADAAAHPPCLSISDARTEKEFIKKAKQVYREFHTPVLKRGPKPKDSFAINTLADLSRTLGRQLPQNKMTKSLMDLLDEPDATAPLLSCCPTRRGVSV